MANAPKKKNHHNSCWNAIGVWSSGNEKCDQLVRYVHCRNCPVFSQAGQAVFEKLPPAGYLVSWRKNVAAATSQDNSKTNSVLIFRVRNEWFALTATILSEVSTDRKIHRIPRSTNDFIFGVVNINGEIKISYSLQNLLEIREVEGDVRQGVLRKSKRLIVIELNSAVYVFPVDEVSGLYWYADSDLLPVPATLKSARARLLSGSIQLDDRQVAVFDLDKFQEKLEGISQ